jgi:hypothetical protein
MPFRFSRRGFVGGLLAALLAAFRRPRVPAAAAVPSPPLPPTPTPPPQTGGVTGFAYDAAECAREAAARDACRTTSVYDEEGRLVCRSTERQHGTAFTYYGEGCRPFPPGSGPV